MTRQTSPIEPAVLKPYRDADEAGPGQRFLPVAGVYEEIWNTELEQWGGVWKEHNQTVQTQEGLWKDYEQTLTFTLPAMGASIWKIKRRIKPAKKVANKTQKGVENEE